MDVDIHKADVISVYQLRPFSYLCLLEFLSDIPQMVTDALDAVLMLINAQLQWIDLLIFSLHFSLEQFVLRVGHGESEPVQVYLATC